MRGWLVLLFVALSACASVDRDQPTGPRVLAVIAHPDDETAFAATLYKLTTHLDAAVDLVVITNGEGGFKYATLAERLYGVELTDEAVGRAELPRIRRAEMAKSAALLGVRSLVFLDELDHRYTTDVGEVLGPEARVWDLERVRRVLAQRLRGGDYDFALGLAPDATTHAHHQAATLLLTEQVMSLPSAARPVLLWARGRSKTDPPVESTAPIYTFDRLQRFGYQDKLDYRIVAHWVIAAHASQGTLQMMVGQEEVEEFELAGDARAPQAARAAELFRRLAEPQFPVLTYDTTAGTNVDPAR